MNTLRIKPLMSAGGMLLALGFTICFFWGYTISDVALQTAHLNLLKITFIGFSGINLFSFFLGFIQSYIFGILGAFFFGSCYNWCGKHIFKEAGN